MWIAKAARNSCGVSQYLLGFLYEKGIGAEKNVHLAAEWYAKAANKEIKAGDQHSLIVQFPGP
jgi:TPR repeat protein